MKFVPKPFFLSNFFLNAECVVSQSRIGRARSPGALLKTEDIDWTSWLLEIRDASEKT